MKRRQSQREPTHHPRRQGRPRLAPTVGKLLPVLALALVACAGQQTSDGPREIRITMTEFAFDPASVEVSKGETIRFVALNEGEIEHELRLTTEHDAEHHVAEGHTDHDDGDAEAEALIVVAPGETGTLEVTFDEAATFNLIACLLPGHFEAGMKAELTVEGASAGDASASAAPAGGGHDPQLDDAAAQVQANSLLIVGDYIDSAGFHSMAEDLAAGEFSGREAGQVEKVITAIDAVAWPDAISDAAASFRESLATLVEELEAEDVAAAAAAADAVHEGQHDISHAILGALGSGHH